MKTISTWIIISFSLFPAAGITAEYLQTPWNLSYSDGSANQYRFEKKTKYESISFVYHPIRPEESSTGLYSGGEPRKGHLTAKQARELLKKLKRLESDPSLRVQERGKGTGAFTIGTPEGTRSFILGARPELLKFDDFLKKLGS